MSGTASLVFAMGGNSTVYLLEGATLLANKAAIDAGASASADLEQIEGIKTDVEVTAAAVDAQAQQVNTQSAAVAAQAAAVATQSGQVAQDAINVAAQSEQASEDAVSASQSAAAAEASAAAAAEAVMGAAVQAATLAILTTITGTYVGQLADVYLDPNPDLIGSYRWTGSAWAYQGPTLGTLATYIKRTPQGPDLLRLMVQGGYVLAALRRRLGTPYADLLLPGGVKIKRAPSEPDDVTSVEYVAQQISNALADLGDLFLSTSGGTLSGALGGPWGSFQAGPVHRRTVGADGFVVERLDNEAYRIPGGNWFHDGRLAPLGPVELGADPASEEQAARKAYVDAGDEATLLAANAYTDEHSGGGGAAAYQQTVVQRVQIGLRCGHAQGSSSTTVPESNMRLWIPVSDQSDWHDLVFVMSNLAADGNTNGAQDITYTLAAEFLDGSIVAITFGNLTTVTVSPGQFVSSNPLNIPLSALLGGGFFLRGHRTVVSGGTTIASLELTQISEGSGSNTSATNQATGGTITPSYGYAPFQPFALLGRPSTALSKSAARPGKPLAALALLGDSIMTGTGDVAASGGSNYLGFASRACALGKIGYSRISVPGQRFNNFDTITRQWKRLQAIIGCTHALCNYGTNDITQGVTLSALIARSDALASVIAGLGLKYIPVTLTPRTNGTNDGYYGSDTADTTALRLDYNAYLMTNPYGNGIYDLAGLLSDPSNPRFWTTAYGATPADGLHPITAMHAGGGVDLNSQFINLLV